METLDVSLVGTDIYDKTRKVRLTIVDITGRLCTSYEMSIADFIKKATHLSVFAPPDVMNSLEFDDE